MAEFRMKGVEDIEDEEGLARSEAASKQLTSSEKAEMGIPEKSMSNEELVAKNEVLTPDTLSENNPPNYSPEESEGVSRQNFTLSLEQHAKFQEATVLAKKRGSDMMKQNPKDTRKMVEAEVSAGNLDSVTGQEVLDKLDRTGGIDASRIKFEVAKQEGEAPSHSDNFINGMSLILAPLLGGVIGAAFGGGSEGFAAGAAETSKITNTLRKFEQQDIQNRVAERKFQEGQADRAQDQANFETQQDFRERQFEASQKGTSKNTRFVKTELSTEGGDAIAMIANTGQLVNLSTGEPLPKGTKTKNVVSERQARAFEQQLNLKSQLSDGQVTEVGKTITMKRRLNEIGFSKQIWKGPIKSRINALKIKYGLSAGDKFDTVAVKTSGLLNKYLKDMSGAAINPEEAARLQKELPLSTDEPKLFFKKLSEFKSKLDTHLKTTLQVITAGQSFKTGSVDKLMSLIDSENIADIKPKKKGLTPAKQKRLEELRKKLKK